jgi:demethylmenaquinone methyltransferase/2-methoxy-6-polyprenyl-1,4-benzoquinol methylase
MSDGKKPFGSASAPSYPDASHRTAGAVRKMFSAVAPRYDFLNHFLSLGRDIAWRKATTQAVQRVLKRPGSRVVDLCCGTGDLAFELERNSAGKVFATDFCHPMLALARQKDAGRAILFLEADTLALPFPDASFDAASIAFGFRNLSNYEAGLREIRRVLKPQGVLAILEFSEVRWPIFGPLFRMYFRYVLPKIGSCISGVQGPYQYLPDSVARFPNQESLSALLRTEGFRNVRYINFTGGVAALHLAEKG